MKCTYCGSDEEVYECEDCGKPVCYDCSEPFTQFNQLTETVCQDCGAAEKDMRADHYLSEEKEEKARQKKREHRNSLARERYRRPENVEKRRIKSEALKAERMGRARERAKYVTKLMHNIFKHM